MKLFTLDYFGLFKKQFDLSESNTFSRMHDLSPTYYIVASQITLKCY